VFVVVFVVCVQCWCYKYGVVICCEEIGSFARARNFKLLACLLAGQLSTFKKKRKKGEREAGIERF
jgi:hypothetical protein